MRVLDSKIVAITNGRMRVSGVYLQTVQGTGLKDLLVSTGGQKLKRYHSGATGIDISPEHIQLT